MPLPSVIVNFTTAPVPCNAHGPVGSPGVAQTSDSSTMCGQVRTRRQSSKQIRGVSGSESKSHLNPLIGNNSEVFRHDVVTIRCKHRISDLGKTGHFCSIFVKSRILPCVFKFPSTALCEFEFKVYNLIARFRS